MTTTTVLSPAEKSAEVKLYHRRPTIFINGEPYSPNFYALTHVFGGRWSWEEVPARNLKNFYQIGFRLFQVDLYFEDIWYEGSYELDLAKVQRQVRGVLEACPEAAVVLRVHVNAPFWWNEAHRDECTEYADGPIDNRTYGPPFNNEDGDIDRPLRASLASLKWREAAGEKLIEFCERVASTPEGKAVIGLHVAGGIYGEWHYWGFIEHDPDTGPAMTRYFRHWLQQKYQTDAALQSAWQSAKFTLETATVPDTSERNFTAQGIFRDPSQERRVIDYFTCQQEVVADDIEYFCKIVKEHWPRPILVGIFYGYFHMTFCRQATGGHLFIERLLDSPYIDYLSAPQTYWEPTRKAGGSGNSRGIIESTLLHGKLWLDEIDNGYLQNYQEKDFVRSVQLGDPQYIPVLRRSALFPLMRGIGLWYYDFGPRRNSGWWDSPIYLENIRAEKQFFDRHLHQPYQSVADVLFVWDMESFYYVKNSWTPLCYKLLDQAVEEALHAGAVTDHIYLFDLKRVKLDRYRVIIFMNTFYVTEEQRQFIQKEVAQKRRTLVWNYLPGFTDGERLNLEWVKQNVRMDIQRIEWAEKPVVVIEDPAYHYEFEAPVDPLVVINDPAATPLGYLQGTEQVVFAQKELPTHTSIYATLPLLGTAVYRKILTEAGCHIYNAADDFTYANSGLIMIHTTRGGQRNLHLRNGKKIEIKLEPFSTVLLDAATGQVLLK